MSKMNKDDVILSVLIGIGIVASFGLLYGMFVYNHSQDVSRDKFLIEHCQALTEDKKNLYTDSKTYGCTITDKGQRK